MPLRFFLVTLSQRATNFFGENSVIFVIREVSASNSLGNLSTIGMKKVCELGHRKYLGMLSAVKTAVDSFDTDSLYTPGQVNLDMGRSGTLGTGSGHRLATNFTFAPSSIDRCFGRLFW